MLAPKVSIRITSAQRVKLQSWSRSRTMQQRTVQRARIILMAADGVPNQQIASQLGVARQTVISCRQRFAASGLDSVINDAPRSGRPPTLSDARREAIVKATMTTTPPDATHWSTRSMARAQGVSPETVRQIWKAHDLKPHQVRTFKLSNDPAFAEKLRDVVGLYLNPPKRAIVFSVDEKSQIQALDRTQPSLPMKPGRAGTMTHDYKRNGLATLFAALNIADGTVIARCKPRHRHQEFLAFLKVLDAKTPKRLDLHLVVDNYRTHKHPVVNDWLEQHPRFHLHFTPTSSSWLNLVERYFAEITRKRIRRGTFRNVGELIAAINDYVKHTNADPKPFVWTKTANQIIRKINRAREALPSA
ncbi:MAG: IS630 family transposase [Pirellulales bacterium]